MPTKRVSDSSKAAIAKKQKCSPAISSVLDAIAGAEHISSQCRQMLSAGCPESLGEFADQRHAYQEHVVNMIGEVLSESKQHLAEKVATADSNIREMESKRMELVAAAKEAEVTLETKARDMETVENELFAVSDIMMSARRVLDEARTSQAEGSKKFLELTTEKDSLETTLQHLMEVMKGSAAHTDALVLATSKLTLEETLRFSLDKTLAKPLAEHGSFDHLVLEGLEQMLRTQISKLQDSIAEEQPRVDQQAAAVAAAERDAEDASVRQNGKATELESARRDHEQQLAQHGAAIQAECDVELQLSKGVKAREMVKSEFEAFTFPWENFNLLKDRLSKNPEPEPAAVETPQQQSEPDVVADVSKEPVASCETVEPDVVADVSTEPVASCETVVQNSNCDAQLQPDVVVEVPSSNCTIQTSDKIDVEPALLPQQCSLLGA